MIDVTPKYLIELRDDPAVDAICHERVRIDEPAPDVIHPTTGAVIAQGDARGPGEYVAFVVIARLAAPHDTRSVGQYVRVVTRCYGRTPQEAYALYSACVDVIHNVGPRVHGTTGIYLSFDDTGATPGRDPVTQQPYEEFIASLIASTQAVA